MKYDFDIVIIGSGFAGSAAALRLVERGYHVCLLERGREYALGSFPRSPSEMAENFWDPDKGLHGLFHIFTNKKLAAVMASGVGGGSLVYANVLVRKPKETFVEFGAKADGSAWPIGYDDLVPHYERFEKMLGVTTFPHQRFDSEQMPRVKAMQDAARDCGLEWKPAPLGVTFDRFNDDSGREACNFCSECIIGCNRGAKNSLDFTVLKKAREAGLELRANCEVRLIRHAIGDGFLISYLNHDTTTNSKFKRAQAMHTLRARKVVLAAGSLNSTYLLMKSAPHLGAKLSKTLGTRFSGNGDVLAFGVGSTKDLKPHRGTTITSVVEGPRYMIQDGGVPLSLAWWMDGLNAAGFASRFLGLQAKRRFLGAIGRHRSNLSSGAGGLFGSKRSLSHQMPLVSAGHEPATGRLFLNAKDQLDLKWESKSDAGYYKDLRKNLKRMIASWGARSMDLHTLLAGRISTVHPLGGCPMGLTAESGTVSPKGEVFGVPGLFVVDGAIVPSSVGVNPALTIAAIADRIATEI